jgi:23S rRNA (cytosine1962-C5)-methyltransferase
VTSSSIPGPPFELPPLPEPPAKVLKMRADRALSEVVRRGHPWVYRRAAADATLAGEPGSLVTIYDHRNRFLAAGLLEVEGAIAVRVFQVGRPAPLDGAWFEERVRAAAALREPLEAKATTGYRILHGENDGVPGVVLDRYAETVVLKIYTTSWIPHLHALLPAIAHIVPFERMVLRMPRRVAERTAELHGLRDGQVIAGTAPDAPVRFWENGLMFEADVVAGQKTGFFLDQRDNRQRVRGHASGRRTLNVCSHAGGFSVYAASGGAAAVCDLDISARALGASERNFALNPWLAHVKQERIRGDVFDRLPELARQGRAFDMVIVDPPSFAMREADRARARSVYELLATRASALVAADGMLVACSCSAHVSELEFEQAVLRGLGRRRHRVVERAAHALDHPIRFPEGRYLKALYITL